VSVQALFDWLTAQVLAIEFKGAMNRTGDCAVAAYQVEDRER